MELVETASCFWAGMSVVESVDGPPMRTSVQLHVHMLRGRVIRLAGASSLLHAGHSPLRDFQTVVDAALESPASASSNAVATSFWKPCSDEWLECKSELESARLITRPFTELWSCHARLANGWRLLPKSTQTRGNFGGSLCIWDGDQWARVTGAT